MAPLPSRIIQEECDHGKEESSGAGKVRCIHAGVNMGGNIAKTASAMARSREMLHRPIYVRGREITQSKPAPLQEIAILQELLELNGWVKIGAMRLYDAGEVRICAGDYLTEERTRKRLQVGALELAFLAASEIAGDIHQLESWKKGAIILRPFGLLE